jgi:phosphate/sulfate permease
MVVGITIKFFPYYCWGLIGSAIASSGSDAVISGGVIKIVSFIFIAPLLGMVFSYFLSTIIMRIFRKMTPFSVDKLFRRLQIFSTSAFSLGHGGNDAQKSMGIIWSALINSNNFICLPGNSFTVYFLAPFLINYFGNGFSYAPTLHQVLNENGVF